MIAASLLVVAVVATYASLAMLSLSVSAPGLLLRAAGSVASEVGHVGWQKPSVGAIVNVHQSSDVSSAGLGDVSLTSIPIGVVHGTQTSTVAVGNPTTKALLLRVAVVGDQVLGLTASFAGESSTALVQPKTSALVTVTSNPLQAGPFSAFLKISVPNSQITPKLVPIIGAQAPDAPGPVTATAAKGGAVNLSWTPSPSTGVVGYMVQSSTSAGGPFTQVGPLTTGTTAVEQTGTNATTFFYEVVAVADGVTSQLPSTPGGVGSATTDSLAPTAPMTVSINPPNNSNYININNCQSIPVSVALAGSSSPNDTITLTVTSSGGGQPFTQTYGGGSNLNPSPNLCSLADGTVTASATATDTLGNASGATDSSSSPQIVKDTVAPDAPSSVQPSPTTVTTGNMSEFAVTVATDALDSGDTMVLSVGSAPPVSTTLSNPSMTLPVDLSSLSDGTFNVTGTITDPAGNTTSFTGDTPVVINTMGPVRPASFQIDPGPNNAADVINSLSQTAVMIDAQFAQPTDAVSATLSINHGAPIQATSGIGTTDISFGPLDLSSLPDGHVSLELTMTDSNGNFTNAWHGATKNTNGPTAPTSVGVPAGPSNPAGYVNAATQSAATIVASFGAPTDPASQIALSVDGIDLAPQAGGSDQATWTADLSSLPDGTLPITGSITDSFGNVTNFSGSLIKDTQAPPAPVAANVVGPPIDTITPQDASCVNVAVAFNVAVDPADSVTVALSDGQTTVQGSAQAGNGQVTVGCIDASSLAAGPISVSVTVTDVAGNSTTVAGTTATKVACAHGGGGSGGTGGGGSGSGSGG